VGSRNAKYLRMVHLSPLVSPTETWQGESSTPPPWQTEGPRGVSDHGGPRAGGLDSSCAFPIPRREVRVLPGGDTNARPRVSFLCASSTPHPSSPPCPPPPHLPPPHPPSLAHLPLPPHPPQLPQIPVATSGTSSSPRNPSLAASLGRREPSAQ
jgi:hypothetical protein